MTEANDLSLGTSITQMNSRTNSHTSDLFNNLFGKPNANSLLPSGSTQYGNNKFKEAVLAEAVREKRQQKETAQKLATGFRSEKKKTHTLKKWNHGRMPAASKTAHASESLSISALPSSLAPRSKKKKREGG